MSEHFLLNNFRHQRPPVHLPPLSPAPSHSPFCLSGLAFIRPTYWLHMAKVDCLLSSRKRCNEEIAASSVIRQVLKVISSACFARVAWRQSGGRGNNEAKHELALRPASSSRLTENWYLLGRTQHPEGSQM